MKTYGAIFLVIVSIKLSAQADSALKAFETSKNNINHNGMIVLTTWSGVTIAASTLGYGLTNSFEEKQFYLMNGAWGLVNLSIALPGLLSKRKPNSSLYNLQKDQTKIEKIFLINAGLDIAYITGGIALKQYAQTQTNVKKEQRFNGFGNAILVQGAGLLVFDAAMTILNNQNRKRKLDPILQKATISFNGTGLKLSYQLN